MFTPTALSQTLCACAVACGLAACLPASASELDDGSIFYCPPATLAAGSQPTRGIMCNAQQCVSSQTPGLSSAQSNFLLTAQGQCRNLSAQEIKDFWPRDLANRSQHAVK